MECPKLKGGRVHFRISGMNELMVDYCLTCTDDILAFDYSSKVQCTFVAMLDTVQ